MQQIDDSKREIPRRVEAPKLCGRTVELLTQLCFRRDDIVVKADVLFVFGTGKYTDLAAEMVGGLLRRDIAPRVIVTGGAPKYRDSVARHVPESTQILAAIEPGRYPHVRFACEVNSRNTKENVEFAVRDCGLADARTVAFVAVGGHAGRAYLTLRRFVPAADLRQHQYAVRSSKGADLHPARWHLTADGRSLIWGEYLRIREYGLRGDLALECVRDTVREIEELSAPEWRAKSA